MPGDPPACKTPLDIYKVSIRARHECRAIPVRNRLTGTLTMFQSAPDMNAGRSKLPLLAAVGKPLFQSAPDMNAGRSGHQVQTYMQSKVFQSAPDMNAGRSEA
ncbi:hypothetical protein Rfer_3909 [Rhodoferax ferrireducens T118]|nr:hypothetical protein Rfer_3909 [Rhodoferax ferrireducens T118]